MGNTGAKWHEGAKRSTLVDGLWARRGTSLPRGLVSFMDSRPSRKRLTNVKSALGNNAVGLSGQKRKLVTDMSQSATDDLVHLLAHQHRREVLDALVDASSSAPIDQCLSWNLDSQDSFEECSRHLDMLERANVIEYDESARTVSRGPNFDRIAPLVRAFSRTADRHDF